jgi:hypothetical protein
MTMTQYWLAQWLDDNEVNSDWGIDHLMHSEQARKVLVETIQRVAHDQNQGQYQYPDRSELGDSIVAGRRLDLSTALTCPVYECLRQSIDSAFKRVWHYFDRIIVEGLSPGVLAEELRSSDSTNQGHTFMRIREQARLVLYLRQIGADRYTIFTRKSFAFCQQHWLEHAKALGIGDALDDSRHEKIIRKLISSSKFDISQAEPDLWVVGLSGTVFPQPDNLLIVSQDPPTPESIAHGLVAQYATAMISDVGLARQLTLPLIEPTSVPWKPPRTTKKSAQPSAEEVALHLRLPVFDHLSTRDFIKMREDHQSEFEAYRSALRNAIRERLDSRKDSSSAAEIAGRIEQEYLRPGLADIERRVSGSRKALVKKTAVDLTVGTIATTVSTMASIPLMITSGVMAVGGAVQLVPMINKYIEDRSAIQMSDLYFLWQAEKEAKHK